MRVLKGVTYEETVRALDDRFGDKCLAAGCRNQLETWTQIIGGSLQEFATTVKELTHHAFPALHMDHVHRGPCRAFGNDIRDQGINSSYFWETRKRLMRPSGRPLSWKL
jgi:hypothetical protein